MTLYILRNIFDLYRLFGIIIYIKFGGINMKTCPHCGELLGDSLDTCFNCMYSFELNKIITNEEKIEFQQKKREDEKTKLEIKENQKSIQLPKNPLFEYHVSIVNNLDTGEIDHTRLQLVLDTWSEKGWRLHSIFNNELGKTSSSVSIGILGSNVNATIDQTVLIFERCIKASTN